MKAEEFCRQLETRLESLLSIDERIAFAAETLGKVFKLKPDEVAILAYDPKYDVLRFVWPLNLKKSGFLPLSSSQSLAVRTFSAKEAVVNNHFASSPHAFIFETVPGENKDQKPVPIQKILSVPMETPHGPNGVIQLSRKAPSLEQAGTDFTRNDLMLAIRIASIVAGYV